MGFKGMPDRVFWLPGGAPLLIEFKRLGACPTPLQKTRIDRLRNLGYAVMVYDDSTEAVKDLTALLSKEVTYTDLIKAQHGAY